MLFNFTLTLQFSNFSNFSCSFVVLKHFNFPTVSLQGNGVIELKSNILVNDGQWHDVKAQFNPAYMEVSVDGEKKSLRPRLGENKHIDLSGLLYFGGIEPGTKKLRAVDQGNYNE
jgi:hypothetical protein